MPVTSKCVRRVEEEEKEVEEEEDLMEAKS